MVEKNNTAEIDLQELLLVYLHKWWLIVLCTILAAALTFGFTHQFITPLYQARISIYVNNTRSTENMDTLTNTDIYAAQRLVNTYVSIAKSDRVLSKVAQKLDHEYTVGQLSGYIRAEKMNETEIFCVYVLHPDSGEAARIANTMAEVAPTEISDLIEGTSARIIDLASVPVKPHSPNYSRSVALGAIVGLGLCLLFLTIIYLSDTRVKDENDLSSFSELPVLGRIPDFEKLVSSSHNYSSSSETGKEAQSK